MAAVAVAVAVAVAIEQATSLADVRLCSFSRDSDWIRSPSALWSWRLELSSDRDSSEEYGVGGGLGLKRRFMTYSYNTKGRLSPCHPWSKILVIKDQARSLEAKHPFLSEESVESSRVE